MALVQLIWAFLVKSESLRVLVDEQTRRNFMRFALDSSADAQECLEAQGSFTVDKLADGRLRSPTALIR